jgi:tetratricopeptide (TPR) repeat protein
MHETPSPIILEIIQLIRENRLHENERLISQAIDVEEGGIASIFKLGVGCAQNNKLNEALIIFKCLQSNSINDVRIPYNLGLIHSLLGNHEYAIKAYDDALRIKPNDLEALINKGSSCNDIKNYELALQVLESAIEINPQIPEAWSNKGIALNNLKFYEQAINAFNQAIKLDARFFEAWSNKSAPLKNMKRLEEAIASCNQAISLNSNYAQAWSNKGLVLHELKRYDEALMHYERALSLKPEDAETWSNKGVSLFKLKRYDQALIHYDKALNLKPDYAEALSNKGFVYASKNQYDVALAFHEEAFKLNPHLEVAVEGILECLIDLGLLSKAIDFGRINSNYLKDSESASQLLAFVHLSEGNKEEAYQLLMRSFEAHKISRATIIKDDETISVSQIKHEFEQLSHLKNKQILSKSGEDALVVLDDALKRPSIYLHSEKKDLLRNALDTCHYFPELPFPSKVLGENDYQQIEDQFINSKFKLVVIDNFLNEEALFNLRQFVQEASIWKTSYANGYVGGFMGSGFCSRAMLSISEELKNVLPRVIGSNRLTQAWAFKYDQEMRGIHLHADFAKVNVNFWITPDEACLDKNTGGMVIYDAPVPSSWSFADYNANPQKLREYLDLHNSSSVKVPYKLNRCVLFDSAYIHNTDQLSFNDGYENRRVNCTLLYGRQLNL